MIWGFDFFYHTYKRTTKVEESQGLYTFEEEISNAGVNTFVTGVAVKNEHSSKAHVYAEKQGINILGGTHYSTEKFACMSMVDYFTKIGLPSEFIEDEPVMEDI